MKIIAIVLALSLQGWATITDVQHVCTGSSTTNACASTTTCTLSGLSAIGAGHHLTALLVCDSGCKSPARTITALNNETWTLCTACSNSNTTQGSVDGAYVDSATGGETSFQMTISSTGTGWNFCIFEHSTTTASLTFDNACIANIAAAAPTTCSISSLSGTNVVKIGVLVWSLSETGVSAPATNFISANGNAVAEVLNVATTTGIAFTPTTNGTGTDFTVAFKEAAGGGVVRHRTWVIQSQ